MVSQEKLVDFDNETVLQPRNLAALFFPKAKEAEEGGCGVSPHANTATKQTIESEDATADEDTAAEEDTAKQTIESECRRANTATNKTFEDMGLRGKKNVATHLLLENAYDSNLLSDISKVDYLAGNLGRTNLQPLEGLPAFVDDIFVFGYLSRDECVFQKGKLSCTSGEKGTAKLVVGSIAHALERALGKRGYMPTAIVHTVAVGDSKSSTIRATIAKIEKNTFHNAKRKWEEIHPQKKIAGYFVAKCDVSEVPLEELHGGLHVSEKCLEGYGYGIYSIDYTQDFSGVLDRKALVGQLGFRKAGDFCTAIGKKEPTILENTDNVGEHVCTWISTTEEGHTARTKIYNKVVSNFEAGEIREPVGGHLAEYADCPNQHLRKTFLHPDVQARGCTRIEVSVYACPQNELLNKKATDCIEEVLEQVSVEEEDEEEYGLFVVQPPSKQWKNLAERVDRCMVCADRPQGHIFVGWFAHTKTGRIAGIHVRPTPANVRDDAKWEKAVLWAAGDFGFQDCPIFRVDILAADEQGVELGPLRCYTKDKNARTILAASKKPTQLHPNGGDLSTLLPPTDKIVWEWRTKKCHAIGNDSSKYKLQEIQEIADQRKISALSTRNREKVLAEIRYARTVEEWKREKWQIEEKQRKKEEEAAKAREAEIAALQKHAETKKKIAEKSREIRATVVGTLSGMETQKVRGLPANKKWDVLGFRGKEGKVRVVLRGVESHEAVPVWATKGLEKILQECVDFFRSEAFLASVRLRFRKTWRVAVAHRTFENFPKQGRKNHRVEPPTSGIRARQRKTCILAGAGYQMRGVRNPLRGFAKKLYAENLRTSKQRDEKNNRLAGRGVHMQTFRRYKLSKCPADHSVLALGRKRWETDNRRRNSDTWCLSATRDSSDWRHRSARKKKNPIALLARRGEDNTEQEKVPQSCPSVAWGCGVPSNSTDGEQ